MSGDVPVPFSGGATWGKRADGIGGRCEKGTGKRGQPAGWQSPFSGGLIDLRAWGRVWTAEQWQAELSRAEDAELVGRLRGETHSGRPLGSDSFLSKVEKVLGRRVRALPVGRPGKRGRERT